MLSKIFLLTLTVISSTSFALVPKLCVHNVTTPERECCPVPNGYSNPCGGIGRGTCQNLYIHLEKDITTAFLKDDRLHWPFRFFKRMCQCEGNFFGIACEQCWYGWEGKKCNVKKTVTRRNIFSFSNNERKMFLTILDISNKIPSDFMILLEDDSQHSDPLTNPRFIPGTFQQFIGSIHRYASRSTLFGNAQMCRNYGFMDYNHNTVAFATWHRALMLYWERELGNIALKEFGWKNFGIPYWDWVDATQCEVCVNELVGSTGRYVPEEHIWLLDKRSHFHNWTEYCSPPNTKGHCVGCHFRKDFPPLNRKYVLTEFPLTEDLMFTLRHSTWYLHDEKFNQTKNCRSFHMALEGFCGRPNDASKSLFMHNKVHNMVHGSMCCAATASNDPLFILHHSQIDRILQCWFDIFSPTPTELPNHGIEPGNCRECNVVGYLPAVKHSQMFVSLAELGVRYDNKDFGKKGFKCNTEAHRIRSTKI